MGLSVLAHDEQTAEERPRTSGAGFVRALARKGRVEDGTEETVTRRLTPIQGFAVFLARGFASFVSPLVLLSMRLDAWADDLGWRLGRDDG